MVQPFFQPPLPGASVTFVLRFVASLRAAASATYKSTAAVLARWLAMNDENAGAASVSRIEAIASAMTRSTSVNPRGASGPQWRKARAVTRGCSLPSMDHHAPTGVLAPVLERVR